MKQVFFSSCLATAVLAMAAQVKGYEAGFASPPASSRPRFRYWLPDASVDVSVVQADIASAGAIGAGGLEFVPFFNYGGQMGAAPKGSEWSKYAFGSPAFKELLVSALTAHKEHELMMDLAIGPNQGQGVPANSTDKGLQWDLIPYTAAVVDNTFDDKLPGWGEGELIAVVSARVISFQTFNDSAALGPVTVPFSWTQYNLDHTTLTDITTKANNATGHMSMSFPGDGEYRIFSFYQRLSGHKNVVFSTDRYDNIFDYGSYAVDHFSAQGAETVINFWERYIVDDQVKDLIKAAGNFAWEDSVEVTSNITWSPSLIEKFEKRFGYSLKRYLPLIAFRNNNLALQPYSPGQFKCTLNTKYSGKGYENDYRTIVSEGYREYLRALRDYFHTNLELSLSVQPSYGLNQDMADSIPEVDAPECESLTFLDSIDAYRQFSGPAHLAGKNVISNEVGAKMASAYLYTTKDLLHSINRALAGGVNQFVIHGQAFSGDYYETTWPGHTPFQYMFSELWSPKQPVWENGLADVLGYVGRTQFVLHQGAPRVDVAVYNKQSATDPNFNNIYSSDDLQDGGWTYSYLSDSSLALPQAVVSNGRLAPSGPAWKALVVEQSQNLTVDTVARIRGFARKGLPVIFAGIPGYYPTRSMCSEKDFDRKLSLLLEEKNVHRVSPGDVAQMLLHLGLSPQTTTGEGSWYSIWRENTKSRISYAFLYNDGNASTSEVTFATVKKPYLLNPWTGRRSAIPNYVKRKGAIVIPIHLEEHQTTVIAFEPRTHSCSISAGMKGGILSVEEVSKTALIVRSQKYPHDSTATLSSGRRVKFDSSNASPSFALDKWSLLVEHWERPSDKFDARTIAHKFNKTHEIASLASWAEYPSLVNVSGVGYYTSTFSWPPETSGKVAGSMIRFPGVPHGLQVYVNGLETGPLDYRNPVIDITPYLRKGENKVLVKVPSTMFNYLRTIWSELLSSEEPPKISSLIPNFLNTVGPVQNGLVGEVEVIPYVEHTVSC